MEVRVIRADKKGMLQGACSAPECGEPGAIHLEVEAPPMIMRTVLCLSHANDLSIQLTDTLDTLEGELMAALHATEEEESLPKGDTVCWCGARLAAGHKPFYHYQGGDPENGPAHPHTADTTPEFAAFESLGERLSASFPEEEQDPDQDAE